MRTPRLTGKMISVIPVPEFSQKSEDAGSSHKISSIPFCNWSNIYRSLEFSEAKQIMFFKMRLM